MTTGVFALSRPLRSVMLTSSIKKERGRSDAGSPDYPQSVRIGSRHTSAAPGIDWLIENLTAHEVGSLSRRK